MSKRKDKPQATSNEPLGPETIAPTPWRYEKSQLNEVGNTLRADDGTALAYNLTEAEARIMVAAHDLLSVAEEILADDICKTFLAHHGHTASLMAAVSKAKGGAK